jgi:hypothetical protein
MRRHALIAGLTSALVASLIAVAPSSANDLRSPDTRDAADAVVLEHAAQSDLRSPDARDAADAVVLQHAAQSDLRSPDTRDVAGGTTQERYGTPDPVQAPVARPQSHFDWIGGGLLVLCFVAVGVGVLVRTRRTVPAVTR